MNIIVFYDTSNYIDFPIGGQLTSVSNFLKYITIKHRKQVEDIFLVGVTTEINKVGKIQNIIINNIKFKFLPVFYRDDKLDEVKKSMRLEFVNGLFKYRKLIPAGKKVIHFLHTPEAFIEIKLCHPFAKTAIFSHGSFFNMIKGFRFYQNNILITRGFNVFIKWMIKHANLIFVLDSQSKEQYKKYNKNIISVNNSIVLPDIILQRDSYHSPLKLLFVGRLSKVKRIDEIINAVELMGKNVELNIIGDGEEREKIETSILKNNLNCFIHLMGAVTPNKVQEYMKSNDILIMNSSFEGKPMTIIEAMSYGMPIITTNVGGISELLDDNIEGVFTDGSKDGIVKAIEIAKQNYCRMSNQACKKAKSYSYLEVNDLVWDELNKI
mgnify:CR=1 FL=1